MREWMAEYAESSDSNDRCRLLREEMTRLREQGGRAEFFVSEAVGATLRDHADRVEDELLAFVANDFGHPHAFRPAGLDGSVQNQIRWSILRNTYDGTNADLDDVRRALLVAHPGIHGAIVAAYRDGTARDHLPGESNRTTISLTVREMVGLVDFATDSHQGDGLSETY